ncbi:hypothetical protein IQ249_04575 [Lusitaniella coriacea LEGE 07157]|uniref:Uncharacterized protein n=1 Tax=Lusitaniella coriacea LEGE 07157 TaxID=945747 RepID=A0A8J7AYW3_9CYAN|nr:hypothetical protein [Lusitaniella coriacea]MBE9115169.1 hypothetical protein [Lusitaniella coriacea LEGE 07157]
MTVQELEQKLLRLSPSDKLRIIQLLAQSLNSLWRSTPQEPSSKLSEFFHQSPLGEVAATVELDLSRDRTLPVDRFTL